MGIRAPCHPRAPDDLTRPAVRNHAKYLLHVKLLDLAQVAVHPWFSPGRSAQGYHSRDTKILAPADETRLALPSGNGIGLSDHHCENQNARTVAEMIVPPLSDTRF